MDNQTVITIIILLLVALLFLIAYINSKKIPVKKKEDILSKLSELENQIKSPDDYARRDAVIKLDNLLAKSLNIRYSNDKQCGDNLKISKKLFDKKLYQQLWDVHKLRNNIVHSDEDVPSVQAEEIYRIYKLGIKHVLK
ncbi:MAG TPA: hypothetical protein PLW18_00420 [Candidatus Dojkabacteria bacterium]|mgnify:FL=1|nr:hypothetical protein [Candidatus Dojkabacteria bacterium]